MKYDVEYWGDDIYRCKKCNTKVAIMEMPCGVSGHGCKSLEEVYCRKCETLLFTKKTAGDLHVVEIKE